MMRGFALGLSVGIFRFALNDILPALGFDDFNLRWDIVMISSFPIGLMAAEFWIRATRPMRTGSDKQSVKIQLSKSQTGG